MYFIFHCCCVLYCIYKFYYLDMDNSTDGVVGPSPGLITIAVIVFAPVLVLIDTIITWVNRFKNK